jgi:NADP-dependent 3-hydroxy acid dehydrogenase YdfG
MDRPDFTGKIVVITGAGRGLGAAFAVVLAELGAEVILTGRNTEQVTTMAEAIGQLTAKKMRDEMPHIDILINNGAQWLPGRMDEHDAYAIVSTISSGVTGTLLFTRGLIKPLAASGAGDILNIISVSGLPNVPLQGESIAFHAAKHGQTGMTEGLRQELRGRPVRVSALYPPVLADISPLDTEAWNAPREPSSLATNRDIVEAGIFALSRPRHVTLSSIVIDPDHGGTLPG